RAGPRWSIARGTGLGPTRLRALRAGGVPAVLANGRISDRSFPRYLRVRRLFRRVLDQLSLCAMQSEEDARRIIAMGARPDRVVVTGNLKMEAPRADAGADRLWRNLLHLDTERIWIAGSTHRGEEAAVLGALGELRRGRGGEGLCVIVAPRHPERADEVEALARERGLAPVRRSRLTGAPPSDVILLDTIGELAALYAVADVIFVGGSLVPVGGHNVIEPA